MKICEFSKISQFDITMQFACRAVAVILAPIKRHKKNKNKDSRIERRAQYTNKTVTEHA